MDKLKKVLSGNDNQDDDSSTGIFSVRFILFHYFLDFLNKFIWFNMLICFMVHSFVNEM